MRGKRGFRLRPANTEDQRGIRRLVFAVLKEYGLAPDPNGTDADLRDLESHYRRRGGAFDVLEDRNGRIVGCVGLFPLDAQTCELRKMYLAPSVRGRGLGRRLLNAALRKAERLGFHRVSLETAAVLTEAIALYTRYGFRPFTPDHMSARCDQAYFLDLSNSPSGRQRPTKHRGGRNLVGSRASSRASPRRGGPYEDHSTAYAITPIGSVESPLKERAGAPRQGSEGAPDAWVRIRPEFAEGLRGIKAGHEIVILTLLHEARRDVLKVRPRRDATRPLIGVFATRSPDRPNPIGLHRTKVLEIDGQRRVKVQSLEAIDGTPVIDIKPVLDRRNDS